MVLMRVVTHKGRGIPHPFWISSGQTQVINRLTKTLVRRSQRRFLQSPGAGAYGPVSCCDETLDATGTSYLSNVSQKLWGDDCRYFYAVERVSAMWGLT